MCSPFSALVRACRCILGYFLLLASQSLLAQTPAFSDSDLPIFIINTFGQEIPDEPKITAHLAVIWNGPSSRNSVQDSPNAYNGQIGLELRGNGTLLLPKNSLGFETRTTSGDNLNVSLLGLPAENDWILYAPYVDKSLIKNVLTYHIAREMGHYASRTRYVEVVVNGEYLGIYVLMEKIKRDKNRVNIDKLEADENSGDELTGGYIIRIDQGFLAEKGWLSTHEVAGKERTIGFQYYVPKIDEITSEQKAYIEGFFREFEDEFYASSAKNSAEVYAKYIDLPSFIDFFLINEFVKNPDAYRLSTFFYKEKDSEGGKLHAGPVWDFNFAYGNYRWQADEIEEWTYDNGWWGWPNHISFWWPKFMSDPYFFMEMTKRWRYLRENQLSVSTLHMAVDSFALITNEAQERNFERWPVMGVKLPSNWYAGDTYQEEVDHLKWWIGERLTWMDGFFMSNFPLPDTLKPETQVYSLSPNPAQENPALAWYVPVDQQTPVELWDMQGRIVRKLLLPASRGMNYEKLDIAGLTPGIYQVRLKTTKGLVQLRLSKLP